MEKYQFRIDTTLDTTCALKSSCGPESIRQLKPLSPLSPLMVDTMVALSSDPDTPPGSSRAQRRPVYLGTEIYTEIMKPDFGESKRLVRHIGWDRPWTIGIFHGGQWNAVKIIWEYQTLLIYDPTRFQVREQANNRRDKINDVGKTYSSISLSEAYPI
jgi:hypothetical protein